MMQSVNKFIEEAVEIATEVGQRARAVAQPSFFGFSCTANQRNPAVYFSRVRNTSGSVGCAAVFRQSELILDMARAVDGLVDYLLIDVEGKIPGWSTQASATIESVKKSSVLTYHPNDLTALAADALVAQMGIVQSERPLAIIGAGHVGGRIAQRLVERGHLVRLWRRNPQALSAVCVAINTLRSPWALGSAVAATSPESACMDARVIFGCTPGTPGITPQMVEQLPDDAIIIDVGNGSLSPEAIDKVHARQLKLLCCDVRLAYEGAVAILLEATRAGLRIGRRPVGGVNLISGGVLGRRGDVIVDDYASPKRIIGIADGRGDVISDTRSPEWGDIISLAEQEISRCRTNTR